MWFVMTALARKGRPMQYIRSTTVCWLGNLIGALLFASCMSVFTGTLQQEPWKSGIVSHMTEDIVELEWHRIFLRAIGCGYLVSIAMVLGTQNQDGISRALAMWLPFVISTTARFPHTVEYMYLASTSMMLGAPLSVAGFLWKCMLPITLGNAVGGGVFVGAYLWWVNLHRADDQKSSVPNGWQYGRVAEDEDE